MSTNDSTSTNAPRAVFVVSTLWQPEPETSVWPQAFATLAEAQQAVADEMADRLSDAGDDDERDPEGEELLSEWHQTNDDEHVAWSEWAELTVTISRVALPAGF